MEKRVPGWIVAAWGVAGRGWRWVRGWMGKHLLGVSLAIMVAGLVGGVVVTAVDPSWVSAGESGSTTIRNLGFVIAGLVALPLAVWRARVADRQAEATQRQAETAHDDLRNRRYQESAAMLGSGVLTVRLAGIYALQQLAKDHPEQYHIEIMKLLCAFVRHPTKDKHLDPTLSAEDGKDSASSEEQPNHKLRDDVQAAMEAICACHARQLHLEAAENFRLDLRGADLKGAMLPGANFSGARLERANLRYAFLADAIFADADLSGVILVDADLSGAVFGDVTLVYAGLVGWHLADADRTRADFTFKGMVERSSRARLRHVPLLKVEATGLTQAQLDSARADPDNPPDLHGVKEVKTGFQFQLVPPGRPYR